MYVCAITGVGGWNGNRVQQKSGPFVYKVRRQLLFLGCETINGW